MFLYTSIYVIINFSRFSASSLDILTIFLKINFFIESCRLLIPLMFKITLSKIVMSIFDTCFSRQNSVPSKVHVNLKEVFLTEFIDNVN